MSEYLPDRFQAALQNGFARLRIADLSRASGVSYTAIYDWLRGDRVRPETDAAIRSAIAGGNRQRERTRRKAVRP